SAIRSAILSDIRKCEIDVGVLDRPPDGMCIGRRAGRRLQRGGSTRGLSGGHAGADHADRCLGFVIARDAATRDPEVLGPAYPQCTERNMSRAVPLWKAPARSRVPLA